MSSANSFNFTSFFLIWMHFISISCLIALAKTFNTMLKRSEESGHPCPIYDLSGEEGLSGFHTEFNVGCGLVKYVLYYIEKYYLYAHFIDSFHHK